MKILLYIIGVLILLGFMGFTYRIIMIAPHGVTNTIQTAHDSIDKTINATNAIYNYEWFKTQYEDIQAIKIKIKNTELSIISFKESLGDNLDFMDKQELARLNTIHLGLMNQYEDIVAKYNARSKMATRNIFENSVMPSFIDSFTFLKK